MPTTAPDRWAMKLGCGPDDGSGGEKRSHTARPTSELTIAQKRREGEMKIITQQEIITYKTAVYKSL